MSYIVAPGETSKSIMFQLVDDVGIPVVGKVAATLPPIYYWLAGANAAVQITLSDLATISTAWSSGGVKEIDSSNLKGYYRLDYPNAAIASEGEVRIAGEATNMRVVCETIKVLISLPHAPPGTNGLPLVGTHIPTALGANGNLKSDVRDLLGTAWLTPGTAGTPDVNTKLAGGTAWGSGAITAGSIAAAALTAAKFAADAIDANALAASAVSEIQSGLSTYAGGDTSGTTTLLSRLTALRAGYLDNINNSNLVNVPAFPTNFATLGINSSGHLSRVTLVDTTTANTDMRGTDSAALAATALSTAQWSNTRAAYLDSLNSGVPLATDAVNATSVAASAVAEIQAGLSTYAGGDTSGTTTLLSRLSATRAGYLDGLSAGVPTAAQNATAVLASVIETGVSLTQAIRAIAAAAAGKRSNSGTTLEQFDAIGNPGTARIVGNMDGVGDGTPTLSL